MKGGERDSTVQFAPSVHQKSLVEVTKSLPRGTQNMIPLGALQIIFFLWFFFEEAVFSFPSYLSRTLLILRPVNSCDFPPVFLPSSMPFCFILFYSLCWGKGPASSEDSALLNRAAICATVRPDLQFV